MLNATLQYCGLVTFPFAIAALEQGLAVEPEPDIRSRLLAQLAVLSDLPTRRKLFEQVLALPNANLMSRTMAEVMLRHLGE